MKETSFGKQPFAVEQPRGVLPYIGYTGMYHWKEYGFQAI